MLSLAKYLFQISTLMRKILFLPIIILLFFLGYVFLVEDTKINEIKIYSKKIKIYSKIKCDYCVKAKKFFKSKNLPYIEIDITWDRELQAKLIRETSQYTVPYIFIDGKFIGGYSDLIEKQNDLSLNETYSKDLLD